MKTSKRNNGSEVFYKYISNDFTDNLYIITVGRERCGADKKTEGPFVKNRFVIHFVTGGKGHYNIDGKNYYPEKNDVFFIPPNHTIYYAPDANDPWSYMWFEFNGSIALKLCERAQLSAGNPVYRVKNTAAINKAFTAMIDKLDGKTDDLVTVSGAYRFFSEMIAERMPGKTQSVNARDELIGKIFDYISANYPDPRLSLSDIAAHFNMNASYMSRFFRETTGMPVSKYIIDYRMQKAIGLLERADLSVKSIALSVGYSDPLYFSREFTRRVRTTPTSYRKEAERNRSAGKDDEQI